MMSLKLLYPFYLTDEKNLNWNIFFFKDEMVSSLQKRNKILNDEKETLVSHEQRLSTSLQNLEAEKRELHFILDKRTKENDRLNGNEH